MQQTMRFLIGLCLIIISTTPAYSDEEASRGILERNRQTIVRYFEEVWNQGNLEVLDELLDSGYINHSPGIPNPEPGPNGLKPIVSAIRTAFPDLKYVIQNMVVTENQVAVHVLMTGTHTGDFFGIAPTGKRIRVSQMQIERLEDGKMVEHWRVTDDFSLMKQVGKIK
jgi:steroid delta-isomerase-like uncharacterized protein